MHLKKCFTKTLKQMVISDGAAIFHPIVIAYVLY